MVLLVHALLEVAELTLESLVELAKVILRPYGVGISTTFKKVVDGIEGLHLDPSLRSWRVAGNTRSRRLTRTTRKRRLTRTTRNSILELNIEFSFQAESLHPQKHGKGRADVDGVVNGLSWLNTERGLSS